MPTKRGSMHGKKLKIINMNCQSISAKRDEFLVELDLSWLDIVVDTESWLNPDIASGEVFPPNYQVFRRDCTNDAHGSIFIAVIDSLVASEVNNIQPDCENIWIFGAFYRPPTTDEVYIGKLGQAVEMIPLNANLLLLGDFNIPDIDCNSFTFHLVATVVSTSCSQLVKHRSKTFLPLVGSLTT